MQQEPWTFQNSCSHPIPEDDNRAPWSVGLHDYRLHLTLSRQWFTHRFTCTFQWCSSALILITSTAPIPSVQTSSSFGCRTSSPSCPLCGSFLTFSLSRVFSPCVILFTSQPLLHYGYHSSHMDSGYPTCMPAGVPDIPTWTSHKYLKRNTSVITDAHLFVIPFQVCSSPAL